MSRDPSRPLNNYQNFTFIAILANRTIVSIFLHQAVQRYSSTHHILVLMHLPKLKNNFTDSSNQMRRFLGIIILLSLAEFIWIRGIIKCQPFFENRPIEKLSPLLYYDDFCCSLTNKEKQNIDCWFAYQSLSQQKSSRINNFFILFLRFKISYHDQHTLCKKVT